MFEVLRFFASAPTAPPGTTGRQVTGAKECAEKNGQREAAGHWSQRRCASLNVPAPCRLINRYARICASQVSGSASRSMSCIKRYAPYLLVRAISDLPPTKAQRNVNAIRRDSGDGRGLAEEQNLFRGRRAGEILAWLLTRRGVCASNCCVKVGLKVYAKVVTLVFPQPLHWIPMRRKNAARQPRG